MRKPRFGFTLIELVIVIAIIGILASLSIPKFIDMSTQSKIAASKAGLGALRAALATKYAASATAGATASYPTALAASDFAGGVYPENKVGAWTPGVEALGATESGTFTGAGMAQYWFVSDPGSADYGKAGAYSDGVIDTSGW
jgi:MSHA pilin protein MshA